MPGATSRYSAPRDYVSRQIMIAGGRVRGQAAA